MVPTSFWSLGIICPVSYQLMLSHQHHHPASPPANCQALGFQEGLCSVMLFTHGGVNNHKNHTNVLSVLESLSVYRRAQENCTATPPGSLQARRFSGRRAHTSSPDTPIAHTYSNFVELEKIPINRHLSVYKSAFYHRDKICEIINFKRRKVSWLFGLLLWVYSSTINCEGSSLPGIWWRKPISSMGKRGS